MDALTVSAPARGRSRRNIALWTIQIVLTAFFAFAAVPKLAGDATAVQMFSQIGLQVFHQAGAGQWLLYITGVAELAGAIGLLIPALAPLGRGGPSWQP